MARYKDPVLKRCRSLGIDPTYLGYNKKSKKNPNNSRKKVSEYGLQLKEKQKAKFVYGVLEKQFRGYFEMANSKKGITGENLLQILESRLDNVVYRLGFGTTRPQARLLVTHGNIEVNGRKVDIASYLVKPGDVVSVREIRRDNKIIKTNLETNKVTIPDWLQLDEKNLSGKIVRLPAREEIDIPVEEHLIVELYSK